MATLAHKSIILGSVAAGPFANFGNQLIERATLDALGLPPDTPRFSVFEPMTEALASYINQYELVVFTGCTILQGSAGHQCFFNDHCAEIRIPKLLCAGAFCCQPDDAPGDQLARWFDPPLAARDPWTSAYLSRIGIGNVLVGCPTLLAPSEAADNGGEASEWTLFSSTPQIQLPPDLLPTLHPIRYVRHEPADEGTDVTSPDLFQDVRMTVTGRLHLALPSIARGIPVRFFGPEHWVDPKVRNAAGPTRLSLLEYLGVSLSGELSTIRSLGNVQGLHAAFDSWKRYFF